jgi:hypothetical protein
MRAHDERSQYLPCRHLRTELNFNVDHAPDGAIPCPGRRPDAADGHVMTAPTDEIPIEVLDLAAALDALEETTIEERIKTSMLIASFFLEYAAYEMALERAAGDVAELIHLSAKINQAAYRLKGTAAESIPAQALRK